MKTITALNRNFNCYQKQDIEKLRDLISQAQQIVEDTIVKYDIKDLGTCVMDGGIKIYFLPSRARKNFVKATLIRQPFQGNISNFEALQPALKFLQDNGVECFYDDGRMD